MFMIATMVFIGAFAIFVYKLCAWNSEKRRMIHATRDVVVQCGGELPPHVEDKLRKVLDMPPVEK